MKTQRSLRVDTSAGTMRWGWMVCLAVLLVAPVAIAGNTVPTTTIKTPPLANSDSIIIPLSIHIPQANPPFAGIHRQKAIRSVRPQDRPTCSLSIEQ